MTNLKKALAEHKGITAAIRECAEEIGVDGEFATHEVTDLVLDRYSDLFHAMGETLIREAVSERVRAVLTQSIPKANSFHSSLFDVAELGLPGVLSLDVNGGRWVYFKKATVKEIRLHRRVLHVTVERVQESLQKVDHMLDIASPFVDDEDEPIMRVLNRVAEFRTANESEAA